MRPVQPSIVAACALVLVATAVRAEPVDQRSVSVPTAQLKYGSTGVTDGIHGEVKAAAAYGDSSRGAHGTFLKMPGGFVSPVHTHSSDEWGAVIAGVFANGKPGSQDILLPAGSYFFQKAGEAHVSRCVSENECIIFLSQNGKYDFIPTK
jgi:beta-alanine degradation protein BauB